MSAAILTDFRASFRPWVAWPRFGPQFELNAARERITATFLDTLAVSPVSIRARKTLEPGREQTYISTTQ
jgi:hypothetical protein